MNVRSVLPRDAIQSIDDPRFDEAYFGDDDDQVVVVDGDPPRAYPIRILGSHEIVNDVVPSDGGATGPAADADGRPVAVTWCPICWSAAVYDRRVGDGRCLEFGVSGKLADDTLVMYDRETGSEWKQSTGVAFAGELGGTQLTTLPGPIVSWERFRAEHPDGVVLQPVRAHDARAARRVYDVERYEQYAAGGEFGLYGMRGEGDPRPWDREDLDPMEVVLGLEHGGEAMGYPVRRVRAAGGVVTDTVGGLDVVVVATDDGVHAFEDPGFSFEPAGDHVRADGTTWDGVTGAGEDGRQLDRVPAHRLFAFTWQDDHGPDAFYG